MPHTTLIAAAELAQNISKPNWIVIDCRHDLANPDAGRVAYAAGHIPGAQFAHLDNDLSDKSPGPNGEFRGRHPLPERSKFIETLRRWGINDDTQVVAYDAQGGMYAARLWWMLRWVGHDAVAVLDGGIGAWSALGLPLSTEGVEKAPGTLTRTPIAGDNRQRCRFAGQHRETRAHRGRCPRPGPLSRRERNAGPGRRPYSRRQQPFFQGQFAGRWQVQTRRTIARGTGRHRRQSRNLVMQCGSGVTACHNLLALEAAGLSGAALYPGSWSEWCANPARPVATGSWLINVRG